MTARMVLSVLIATLLTSCVRLGSITRWPGVACRRIRGSSERVVT